ncbi:MAG: hypothetical protein WCT51_02640 [Candidatus Shapirobacteria bacterium]|jgi:hypothetical protein
MSNDLNENKYPKLALPIGRIKVPKFLYIILIVLGILVLTVGGLRVFLIISDVTKSSTANQALVNDFSSTYSNIKDTELPIGTNILLNPMLKNWSVRVIGVVISKNNDSFILENKKDGYKNINIEIKKCPDREDIIFKIVRNINGTKQSNDTNLDQLSVGSTMNGVGSIINSQNGDWIVCGTYFIINE